MCFHSNHKCCWKSTRISSRIWYICNSRNCHSKSLTNCTRILHRMTCRSTCTDIYHCSSLSIFHSPIIFCSNMESRGKYMSEREYSKDVNYISSIYTQFIILHDTKERTNTYWRWIRKQHKERVKIPSIGNVDTCILKSHSSPPTRL